MSVKSFLSSRFERTISREKNGFDYELEGVRGFAAILVFISHVVNNTPDLMTGYHFSSSIWNVGHSAVVVFFMLSGYVIGLTNKKAFSSKNSLNYLYRRAVRVLPIYYIVLIFSLSIMVWSGNFLGLKTLLGHFLLLPGVGVPSIESNSPLWSLSYEICYYLFYLLIWCIKPPIILTCVLILLPSILLQPLGGELLNGLSLGIGFIFWLGGLAIALKKDYVGKRKIPCISLFCLFLLLHNLQPGGILLQMLGLESFNQTKVSLADLIQLFPFCLLIISLLTGRGSARFLRICLLGSYGFSIAITLLILMLQGFNPNLYPQYGLLLISLGTFFWRQSTTLLCKFAYFGKFSYAFYIIHWPILYILALAVPWNGVLGSFVKVSLAFGLSVLLSILLEIILQPIIKRKINLAIGTTSVNPKPS